MNKTCEYVNSCGMDYCRSDYAELGVECPDYKKKMKPILFNTEMVKAILEGRKTQTRRIIKPQPYFIEKTEPGIAPYWRWDDIGLKGHYYGSGSFEPCKAAECALYQAGDILWIRETWCDVYDIKDMSLPSRSIKDCDSFYYKADYDNETAQNCVRKWHPSIHMPKKASRVLLKVTNVRVERLQDMCETDALAEGIKPSHNPGFEFMCLWDQIYFKQKLGWKTNPWVWVIEFERMEGHICS